MVEKSKQGYEVVFFETESSRQPVKEFILELTKEDRKELGADIRSVQMGFPMGLPLVRKMAAGLWEIRSTLKDGICRVFFTTAERNIVLLHAFTKKAKKTPLNELSIATERLKDFKKMQK
jgi:phage-related protein